MSEKISLNYWKEKKKKMLQKKLKEMFEFLNLYVPKTNLKSVTIAAS